MKRKIKLVDPRTVRLGDQNYQVKSWSVEKGRIAQDLGFSTAWPPGYAETPYATAINSYAFDGEHFYTIGVSDQEEFWKVHEGCTVYLYASPLELKALRFSGGESFSSMLHKSSIIDDSIYKYMLKHEAPRWIPGEYIVERMARAYFCWHFFVLLPYELPFWDPGERTNGGEKPSFGVKEECSCCACAHRTHADRRSVAENT